MILRVLLLTVLLSACASYVPQSQQPAPVEVSEPDSVGAPAMVGPPMPPISDSGSSSGSGERQPAPPAPATASSTLLASVDAAIAANDLERAAAIAERALRISPRDATIWYRLASIRYKQQHFADARGLASRALSFAGNDALLRQQIDDLLQQLNRL
jgi:hypothetical protein